MRLLLGAGPKFVPKLDDAVGRESPSAAADVLVIRGEHECQHAGRLRRIGWILRAVLATLIVVVDLTEERLSSELEATEVVLAVRVVVLREIGEVPCTLKRERLQVVGKRMDTDGQEYAAAAKGHAKSVVEVLYALPVHQCVLEEIGRCRAGLCCLALFAVCQTTCRCAFTSTAAENGSKP